MIRVQIFLVFAACGLLVCGCGGSGSGQSAMRRGMTALEERNYPEAIAYLTRASERIAGSANLYYHLGYAHWQNGEPNPAAVAFSAALELNPKHGEALTGLGQIAYYTNNLPQASQLFRQALTEADIASADARASILNSLALTEKGLGRNDQARLYLLRAMQIDRRYAPALYNLASLYRTPYNLHEEALDQLEMYVRIADKNDAHLEKAHSYITRLRAIVERTKAETQTSIRRDLAAATRHLDEGVQAQSEKQFPKAIKSYRAALAADPLAFNAAFGLAMVCKRLNQSADALEAFKRAGAINPNHQDSHLMAAELAVQLRRYEEAEQILDRAIARSPYNPASARLMASIRHAQNRLPEARAYGEFYLSLLRADDQERVNYEKWVRALPEK